MKRMKQAGKTHWMIPAGVLAMAGVVALVMFAGESPQTTAAAFMSALADGDSKQLAELTFVKGKDKTTLESEWKVATERSKFYAFAWKTGSIVTQAKDQVGVRMKVIRLDSVSPYEENYQLNVVKVDGKWKVLPNTLSREMYPYMPRF